MVNRPAINCGSSRLAGHYWLALVLGSLAWDGASTLGFAPVDAGCFMDYWPFICTVPTLTTSIYRPGSSGPFVAFAALECPYPLTTGDDSQTKILTEYFRFLVLINHLDSKVVRDPLR